MKFGHLILRKISKFVATSCQILRLKCTKIDFAPDPLGSIQCSPGPLPGFKGGLLTGGRSRGEMELERRGKGKESRTLERGKGDFRPGPDWESERVATLNLAHFTGKLER